MNTLLAGDMWLFSEGLAAVNIKNRWGFIDKQGNIAIKPQFDMAYGFSEGLATVEIKKKYGFIDKTGAMVIEPQYDSAIAFTEGLAIVYVGERYQIIDKKGSVLVTLDENVVDAGCFSGGLADVTVDLNAGQDELDIEYKDGFIDRTGKIVIEPKYYVACSFEDGIAVVTPEEDGKSGFIDTTGRYVMEPIFDEAEFYSDGVAPVKKDGRWRFVDRTGAEVVLLSHKYEYVAPMHEGRASVKIGEKYGAIDKAGNLLIDAQFDNLGYFSDGLAYARIGDMHGYINTSGNFEFQKPVTKPSLIDRLCGRKDHLYW